VNPFGCSEQVQQVLRSLADNPRWIERYPDSSAVELTETIARSIEGETSRVLPVNGLSQGIWLTAMAFLDKGDAVLIVKPTFGEYEDASRAMGGRVVELWGRKERGFRPDPQEILDKTAEIRPRILWLCNPNNPAGYYLEPKELAAIAEGCAQSGTLLAVDQAYLNFLQDADCALNDGLTAVLPAAHVLLLRSMTKDFALPGLRLGYLVGCPDHIRALGKVRPPWSLNALAQQAGIAALGSLEFYRGTWRKLGALTRSLAADLQNCGLSVFPPTANFVLVETANVNRLQEGLWQRRIAVRDCGSFGLKQSIRVGCRTAAENDRLISAIAEIEPDRLKR
jgi:histidinol-phosphate aminotransferase